jgi:flotillin
MMLKFKPRQDSNNLITNLFQSKFQKAEAELAYELQAAKTKQRIKEENMQIKVIERTQEICIQSQEIQRRERELDSSVRRPAEADKYKLEKLAEAHR